MNYSNYKYIVSYIYQEQSAQQHYCQALQLQWRASNQTDRHSSSLEGALLQLFYRHKVHVKNYVYILHLH